MRPLRLDDSRLRRPSALLNQFAACGAPSRGPSFDACHARDPTLAEKLGCPQRTEAALANHEYWTIAGDLIKPRGQISLGQIDSARDVPVGKLFRLAHINDNRNRWPRSQLIKIHFAHLR